MQMFFCGSKIFLLVGDACQLNQKPRIARRLSNAYVERQLGFVPFLQTSQGQPGQEIKFRRLVRWTSRQFCGFLPTAGIESTLCSGKASLI